MLVYTLLHKMKIYTRKGDSGETSLIGGSRVKKSHIRIKAYGTIDELNSFIGVIRDCTTNKSQDENLERIQNNLFTIGSELASEPNSKMSLPEVKANEIDVLEHAMDAMNVDLPELKNFILPGGDLAASYCHVARTVCRRAERATVEIMENTNVSPIIVRYLNRLSDYLFVLARFYTFKHGGSETIWKTRS